MAPKCSQLKFVSHEPEMLLFASCLLGIMASLMPDILPSWPYGFLTF
jgi:hypothetical protein